MRKQWIDQSLVLAGEKADFYSGARKILRNVHFTFPVKTALGLITMHDCGFTKSKMSMLKRNYLNEESLAAGLELWEERLKRDKYGSVGISTYNHYKKGNIDGASPRGSVMGPCIQSFTLTLLNDGKTSIDVFYRTTELFKKFPADLVFLKDILLEPFKFPEGIQDVNFHFANVTCHPMYYVTLIPHMSDPIAQLEKLRKKDKRFYDWVVKWTARYVCDEHLRGIEKFSQAMRVRMDAHNRIDKATMKILQKYLRAHHPGHRNEYVGDEDEE